MRRLAFALAVLSVSTGCREATEILVVVTSDMSLETIALEVRPPPPEPSTMFNKDGRTLRYAIYANKSADAMIDIIATGFIKGQGVASRKATVNFQRGRIKLLRIELLASCGTKCAPINLKGSELPDYSDEEANRPIVDAGVGEHRPPCTSACR